MAFTQTTVTHTFENADGTAASGSITFSLLDIMTNGAMSLVPAEITANLSGSGVLSQALTSNLDTGTAPATTQWRVDLRILGASQQSFFIVVPVGPGSVDLFTLIPSAQSV